MQKNKNTHQDTNKKEDRSTTPSERTIFIKFKLKRHCIFWGKITINLNRTFNNNKQMGQLLCKGQMQDIE
jgi:hypothetical protein